MGAHTDTKPPREEEGTVQHADKVHNTVEPVAEKGGLDADLENNSDLKPGQTTRLDEAELFLQAHDIPHERLAELMADEQAIKKLRRRVDWRLMPLLCGTYLLQYIDKQAVSYAAVFDLFEDTGITRDQYSWLPSMFYFAYLFAEWPMSYLAQRYPTGKVVSICAFCWGSILMCTVASPGFASFAACRFLLGVFEAVVTPAFMLIVSQWYVREEQPARAGTFYCFNGIGSMVGGILFYGVGQSKSFSVWKTIYLLCGGLTLCWSVVLYFFLPDNIMAAKVFTVEEKAMLIARSSRNRTGVYSSRIKTAQIKEAFKDSQVWLLFLFTLFNETVNGGIANFNKLIVKGFTHDALLTTAYGIPYGAFTAIFMFTGPFFASRVKNMRTIVMCVWLLPTLIAVILFWILPRDNHAGLLSAYYMCASYVGALIVALQMPASNVGGYTKRTTATAFVFLGYCIGNIIGPHAFLSEEAPIYQTGSKTVIGCISGQVTVALTLRFVLRRRNKKREEQAAAAGIDMESEGYEDVIKDVTDFENPRFRYSY